MTPLHKFLSSAAGSELIRKCWGDMPCFDGPCDVIHVSQMLSDSTEQEILFTGIFLTNESGDANECKPSKMLIRFSGVVAWEYDYGCAIQNGIELAEIFRSPPAGFVAVDAHDFRVICQKISILSCEHNPFSESDDEKVAT
jgi:hypothetical protein